MYMNPYLKIFSVLVITFGIYMGVRYFGVVIHYTCAVPEEDCAPPINAVGQAGYYLTGGGLVPLWRDYKPMQKSLQTN